MIELLIGNIASGKSTYCLKRAKEGALIVNDDSIVNALHCDQYDLYSEELKPLYKSLENQIVLLGVCLKKDIVIDRGLNLKPKSRRRFVGMGHSLDVPVCAVVFEFNKPEIHASRRIAHDNRGYSYDYWLKVATRLDSGYVEPIFEEGFDEIIYYKWSEKNDALSS